MALTKQQRDALPAEHFAVPGKRQLPIHDETHTRMAWDMVDKTKDLSDAERSEARSRILRRAKELGLDTTKWRRIKAMSFVVEHLSAMSLDVPETPDHPNKSPFTGVLTKIDQPSDAPPHGAGGKRVQLSRSAAEAALSTLLGMAVDYTPGLDGHDARRKVGVITAATIEGDELRIAGFFYAADFPEEVARIRADKEDLGFSFEAQRILVESMEADPLVITECVFTGAAVLQKGTAAYRSTSLAASAAGEIDMTKEELEALLKPVTEGLASVKAAQGELAGKVEKILAGDKNRIDASNLLSMVEPHAKKLEDCAASMEAAGIGGHPVRGHAAVLRHMAGSMRADAAQGKMPHIYGGLPGYYDASADKTAVEAQAKAIKDAVDAAVKPLNDQIAAFGTKVADLKAAAEKTTTQPQRKTLEPQVTALLAKAGIEIPATGDFKIEAAKLDKALGDAGLSISQRMAVKTGLTRAGLAA